MLNKKVVLIGGGNMGHALLRGILKAGLTPPENFTVVDIHEGKLASLKEEFGVNTATDAAGVLAGAEVVILAVKPYTLNDVLDGLSDSVESGQLFISIVAGVKGGYICDRLGKDNPVVRCMPNIAATVDAAASAICACGSATSEHLEVSETILGAVGEVVRVEEQHMDAVTGGSGSGPSLHFPFFHGTRNGTKNEFPQKRKGHPKNDQRPQEGRLTHIKEFVHSVFTGDQQEE